MKKQTSSRVSSLAARVLNGYKPTAAEVMILAASCLSQDETANIMAERTKEVEPGDQLTSDFYEGEDLSGGIYGEKND